MSKWSECAHTSGVWRVCARSGLVLRKRWKAPEVISHAYTSLIVYTEISEVLPFTVKI